VDGTIEERRLARDGAAPDAPALAADADLTATLEAPAVAAELTVALGTKGRGSPRQRLLEIVARFSRARLLVVGDMVADEYIVGTPSRISREAPVLVLEHRQQFTVPGGATNPGVNARALGAEVYLAGVVGNDPAGHRLRAELEKRGMHLEGVFTEPDRPTSTKTRIVAGSAQNVQQQIVRVDLVDGSVPGPECERSILDCLCGTIPTVDALLISDYENGVVTPAIIETSLALARRHEKIVVVDSHGGLARFTGVTALTPNEPEAASSLGMRIEGTASLEEAGGRLLEQTSAQGVLITRGSEGMSLFEQGHPPLHLTVSNLTEVRDPTGAGDTVSATFTLALVAGASMAEAAVLSTIAAGLVVRRLGCATTTPAELATAIRELIGAR
jgi:rfaE bifunctional protein kinase chain/domain